MARINMLLNIAVTLCLVILVPTLTYLIVFKSQFFTVKAIVVSGTHRFVNQTDLKSLVRSNTFGKNLIFLDKSNLTYDILNSFQGARQVKVSKRFPSTLNLVVVERKPFAVIYNTKNENYLVDEDGYVLGFADPSTKDLPKILYNEEIKIGSFIPRHLVPLYLEILTVSNEEGMKVSSISANSNYVSVYANNVLALFSFEKDRGNSIRVLSKLLQQLAVEGKKPKKIDLRFDKVIVSYE